MVRHELGGVGRRVWHWWRSRSRVEQRLLVLSVSLALVAVVPGLRAAVLHLVVDLVVAAVVPGILCVLGLAIAWRVVRRHPAAGLLVGAWLLGRHERRHRVRDARSWSASPPDAGGDPRSWPPPVARTWRP